MARTQHEGVVWVGDLGNRVTDRALRDVFAQFGKVEACSVVRNAFTGQPSGCGWVRFSDTAVVADVLQLCNETHLFVVGELQRTTHTRALRLTRSRCLAGGSPRPAVLGRCLSDVAPQCCDDPLSVAQGGRGDGGAAPELLTTAVLRRRPGDSAAVDKLRAVLAQQQLEREALQRQVCEAEAAEFEAQKRLVLGERNKLQRLEKLCKAVNSSFDSHA